MAKKIRKKVRLLDIAKAANVSVSAVSMALADSYQISKETKDNIIAICRKLGYKAPTTINNQFSKKIGFLLLGNRFNDEVHSIELHEVFVATKASQKKIELRIAAIEDLSDTDKIKKEVAEFCSGIDGVIASGLVSNDIIKLFAEKNLNFVILGQLPETTVESDFENIISVTWDFYEMGKLATHHLIKKGFCKIAFIIETYYPGMVNAMWLEGYQQALLEYNININKNFICLPNTNSIEIDGFIKTFLKKKDVPESFIIPDVRTAASFIASAKKYDINISPENTVLGGYYEITKTYRLENYPLLAIDMKKGALVTVQALLNAMEGAPMLASKIVVKHNCYNFR